MTATSKQARNRGSLPRRVRSRRTFEQLEQVVTGYANENCADEAGKCKGCRFRVEAYPEDDWCYLAEGILRNSTLSMCPATRTPNSRTTPTAGT